MNVRTHDARSTTATCIACAEEVTGERCEECGAAQQAGPYRVLKVLSRTMHGAMYLAEDDLGAKVALKELVFSLVPSTQELDAFTREAGLLQALSHPRIPRFVRSFTLGRGVSTRWYLAQQFLAGESLAARLTHEHFDEAAVLTYARQALELLAYLHGRSPVVVHRDVKPDNFIVGADGCLSLVDFGAARVVKLAGTHRATLVGTFGYMAPEQMGGSVDARSDLYGLGATLVHLLTRQPPEQLLSPGMSLDFQKHVNVSVKTERFLSRLVAPRPDERFASAQEALAFLDGGRVSAPRSSRRLTVVALSVGIGVVAGLAGFFAVARTPVASRPIEQAPHAAPVTTSTPAVPPATNTAIRPWELGEWSFRRPGHYVVDESGRGHHLLLPPTGFTTEFGGLVWDGTNGLSTPDSKDFAPTGPFTLSAQFTLAEGEVTKPSTVISRGDVNGRFAWAVQVVPVRGTPALRFSIADEAGQVSSIEGMLPVTGRSAWVYFTFDPKTGEQQITLDCIALAKAVTSVRPAKTLPDGSTLRVVTGFRGVVDTVNLSRGLTRPLPHTSCGYSTVRQDED